MAYGAATRSVRRLAFSVYFCNLRQLSYEWGGDLIVQRSRETFAARSQVPVRIEVATATRTNRRTS